MSQIGPFRESHLESRKQLPNLLNRHELLGNMVEVGVWRGDFAVEFVNNWRGETIHLVDPWAKLPDHEYDDIRNRDFDPADLEHVHRRFRREIASGRVQLIRSLSATAVHSFDNDSLDFVYIDANHSYEHTSQDIDLWWDKIKTGGILAGHDIWTPSHPGVTAAVAEFCVGRYLECWVIHGDYADGKMVNAPSWYIKKEPTNNRGRENYE